MSLHTIMEIHGPQYMIAHSQPLPIRSRVTLAAPSTLTLGWVVSLFFVLLFNQRLFSTLATYHGGAGLQHGAFLGASVLLALALINLLVTLGGFRGLFKPWIILLLLTSSLAAYFTNSYGVIIDRDMVRNIMQTHWREVLELLNVKLLSYFFILGVLPSILVARLRIRYARPRRELLNRLLAAMLSALLMGTTTLAFFQDYASIFRNHRELRYLVVPTGFIYALYSQLRNQLKTRDVPLTSIGLDAHLGTRWNGAAPRKAVLIMVVGETARAQNFSLNGYSRITNPALSHEDVINFGNVHSCGTSTAISLPCMFSRQNRAEFDVERSTHSENLLDVLTHANIPVLWRDNDAGCKGVCDRITYEEFSPAGNASLCEDGQCFDEILLQDLEQKIEHHDQAVAIILHMKGSHGPAYYLRTPERFQQFTPFCHTSQLSQCSRAEITNAYDNTILYTDHLLASLIGFLKSHAPHYDSALLYVSDHGESLGENNLYLHGLPYAIAPEEQVHIPLLMWFSEHFSQRFGIDTSCLRMQRSLPFSHDNLFDTVLGMLNIQTSVYRRDNDILAPCTLRD